MNKKEVSMKLAKDFKYLILEKHNITDSNYLSLYTEVFEFWKATWKPIFEKVGSPQAFMVDDFYRQDLIPVILHKGQIVATNFYTIFNMSNPAASEMRYFSIFPPEAMSWVKKYGKTSVMSMEFLAVHPEWRRQPGSTFSYAEALISLGFELMKHKNFDIAVGVPVKITGVQEMAKNLSCKVLAEGVQRGNLACDILGQDLGNIQPHSDENARTFINYLWLNRESSNDSKKISIPGAA
jgi:hypothetical protein